VLVVPSLPLAWGYGIIHTHRLPRAQWAMRGATVSTRRKKVDDPQTTRRSRHEEPEGGGSRQEAHGPPYLAVPRPTRNSSWTRFKKDPAAWPRCRRPWPSLLYSAQARRQHSLYAEFGTISAALESDLAKKAAKLPQDNGLACPCGSQIDLGALRKQVEKQIGHKLVG
jgi:hypothetical protein